MPYFNTDGERGCLCECGLLNQGDTYLKGDRKENVCFCNTATILKDEVKKRVSLVLEIPMQENQEVKLFPVTISLINAVKTVFTYSYKCYSFITSLNLFHHGNFHTSVICNFFLLLTSASQDKSNFSLAVNLFKCCISTSYF